MDFKYLKESLTVVNVLGYALGTAAVIAMHYHFYAVALGLALLVAKCWMHVSRKDAVTSRVSTGDLVDAKDNMTGSDDLRSEEDNKPDAYTVEMLERMKLAEQRLAELHGPSIAGPVSDEFKKIEKELIHEAAEYSAELLELTKKSTALSRSAEPLDYVAAQVDSTVKTNPRRNLKKNKTE